MRNLKDKLNKIEKKIKEKKIIKKKRDIEFGKEGKKAITVIDKLWKKEFENNKKFIGSLNEMLSTFRKLDQDCEYKYIINSKDDHLSSFSILGIKFILANIYVEICIPVLNLKIANIQIYVNWDTDSVGIDQNTEHLKNFKLNDAANAKDFYLNKILGIFEDIQN